MKSMKLEDREDVRELLLGKLNDALSKCTSKQVEFFWRLYPGGIDKILTTKLPWALTQCENTIKKNEAKTNA